MSKTKNNQTETEVMNSTEIPAAEAVILRNYPGALIRTRQSKDRNGNFNSVSFIYQGSWASVILDGSAMSPSKRRDGSEISEHYDLCLGDPDEVRWVSVRAGDDDESGSDYKRIPMFNRTIEASITESRMAYLRSIAV